MANKKKRNEEERLAREIRSPEDSLRALGHQALNLALKVKSPQKALPIAEEAYRLATQHQMVEGVKQAKLIVEKVQQALGEHALGLYANGQRDTALQMLSEQERVCRLLKIPSGLAQSLGAKSLDYALNEKAAEALDAAEEAWRMLEEHELTEQREKFCPMLLKVIGTVKQQAIEQVQRGDLRAALELMHRLEQVYDALKDYEEVVICKCMRATLLANGGRGAALEAVPLVDEAHQIASKHGCANSVPKILDTYISLEVSLGEQAGRLVDEGDLAKALQVMEIEVRLCRMLRSEARLAMALGSQAMLLASLKDRRDEAHTLAEEAHRLATINGLDTLVGALERILQPRAERTMNLRRYIRVFVSSTFRDMQVERDHLVKFIFPHLRQLCESRGVTWGEVDLRWGITEEQSERGEVVGYCLEEIDRCRPFFIGLLGDYYGTLARQLAPDLKPKEGWPEDSAERSVTELEFIHGVLATPEMADHAFFYFRDPAYTMSLPPEQQRAFTNHDLTAKVKLAALKERIRHRHRDGKLRVPPRENYRNPEVLGRAIRRDFARLINELFPEDLKLHPLEREAADHEAFAESLARIYISRQESFDQLDAHVKSGGPPLVVLGESGIGKSALLANWFLEYRENHPDDFGLIRFIGGTPDSADPIRLLRRILLELKHRFPNQLHDEVPAQPGKIREEFPQWLTRVADSVKIILILDGLHQLEDRDAAPDLGWLPVVFPPNCSVILSSLPGRSMDAIRRRQWPEMTVQPLTVPERQELLAQFLAQYSRRLSPARVERIASAEQTANPLFLRAMLDELRQFGEHERLGERIEYYLAARDPKELYELILDRYEQDFERDRPGLVQDAVSLLWAARRGLSEAELLELLGSHGLPLPQSIWSPLHLSIEQSLVIRSGTMAFSNDYLRQAVRDRYLPTEEEQHKAHLRLADYFKDCDLIGRKIDELPWQLAQSNSWRRLYDFLADPRLLSAVWKANEFEVEAYWSEIERKTPLRMVEAYRSLLEDSSVGVDDLWHVADLLYQTGKMAEALFVHEHLVRHYRRSGNYISLQGALNNQARTLSSIGDLDTALALFREVEGISRKRGDRDVLQASLGNQATVVLERGDLDAAMALLKEQEDICREIGNKLGLLACLGNQGAIHLIRGQSESTMALLKDVEQICRELGNQSSLSKTLGNQAAVAFDLGDLDSAMRLLKEQQRMCTELGDKQGLSDCLGNQGNILKVRGDPDGAMRLFKNEERICSEVGDKKRLQQSIGNQADLLFAQGDLGSAITLYRQQERICRELDSKIGLQHSLAGQAQVLVAQGHLSAASSLYKQQEVICRDLGNRNALALCLVNQALILKRLGDLGGAMALLKEQERICRELGINDVLQLCLGDQALVLQEQGDFDSAMALHKERERVCRELGDKHGLLTCLSRQWDILLSRRDPQAMTVLKELEEICRESGDNGALTRSLLNQSLFLAREMNRPREALPLAEEAFRLATEQGTVDLEEHTREVLLEVTSSISAAALASIKDRESAWSLLQDAERIYRLLGNNEMIARHLIIQVQFLLAAGRLREAVPVAEEAYSLTIDHDLTRLHQGMKDCLDQVQQSLDRAAEELVDQGNTDMALEFIAEQVRICRAMGCSLSLVRALATEAMLLKGTKDRRSEAIPLAMEAYELALANGLDALAGALLPILNHL